jgi:alginate O-acetyltransferase complex protein AlgJ
MRSRTLAIGFVVLILAPIISQILGLSLGFNSTENRHQQPVPAFSLRHPRSFVHEFDQYYKENFGLRNALFYAFSHWKYYGLGQSPLPEKVVVGKNGWFYLGNSENRVIDQHRGLLPFSTDMLRAIANRLTMHQQTLARQGKTLYVFVALDSHTIYSENLPDQLLPYARPSRLDQFVQYMSQHTAVPIVDVRDTLLATKNHYRLYYQTDTHWNNAGTLVGCAALLNAIRPARPTLERLALPNYKIEKQRGLGGDLVSLFMLQKKIKDSVYYDITPIARLKAQPTDTIPNPLGGYPSYRFSGLDSRQPRLLLVGDSFSHSLMDYLPGYFSASYFIRSRHLDPKLIQSERPDVVVVEIVERNLNWLREL